MIVARALGLTLVLAAVNAAPARSQPVGIRGYADVGVAQLAAKETFDAVAGTSQRPVYGGGVQVTGVWRGLFADVGVAQVSLNGERVFIDSGAVFALNIPLEVTLRHVDVAAGWRLTFGRLSPYGGVGITSLRYEERSEFSTPDEDVEESRTGPLVVGGLDVALWSWLHAGAELRYRQVTGILGEGGVSAEFGEDNAGGLTAALRISLGR